MLFFVNNNDPDNFIFLVRKVHSFKVFKKSTKFKKYNKGLTKFIMNRKKYTLRKKVTSLINKFMVPLDWANYFSKKRQLIRFYQSYSILSYCTPTVNNKILLRLNDTTSSNPLESPEIIANVNSSFLAKGIARNSSLFNLKIF